MRRRQLQPSGEPNLVGHACGRFEVRPLRRTTSGPGQQYAARALMIVYSVVDPGSSPRRPVIAGAPSGCGGLADHRGRAGNASGGSGPDAVPGLLRGGAGRGYRTHRHPRFEPAAFERGLVCCAVGGPVDGIPASAARRSRRGGARCVGIAVASRVQPPVWSTTWADRGPRWRLT